MTTVRWRIENGGPNGYEIKEPLWALPTFEQAGLLDSKRRQRQIIYKIREEGIQQLLGFLVEDCCGGNPELCGFPVSGLKTEKKEELARQNT